MHIVDTMWLASISKLKNHISISGDSQLMSYKLKKAKKRSDLARIFILMLIWDIFYGNWYSSDLAKHSLNGKFDYKLLKYQVIL